MIETFETGRFAVRHWRPMLEDPQRRATMEAGLAAILTPDVLLPLPPSFQLGPQGGAIAEWVTARAAEAECLVVVTKPGKRLIGLVILAAGPERGALHLGYFLAEDVWGQGAASEIVAGLVSAARKAGIGRLVAGVAVDNPASARVLQKAGFIRDPQQSTPQSDMYGRDLM